MKKILMLLLVAFTMTGLSACSDKKYVDAEVNVAFFTANSGADIVESYLNIPMNSIIEEPTVPVREGYVFTGWYTDYQNTTAWNFDTDRVSDTSIVLYAGWDPLQFEVIYDLNGGEFSTTTYVTTFYAGEFRVLPIAKRAGYKFVGWYTYDWVDATSTIPGDTGVQTVENTQVSDLYVYAHYEGIDARVTFKANYPVEGEGPDSPDPVTLNYGSVMDLTLLDDTDTYEFLGWNTRSDGSGTFYVNGEIFQRTQRITLYGTWKLIE